MQSSQYAKDMQHIFAALQGPGEEDAEQQHPLPEEEPVQTVYVYPTEEGGVLLSRTRLAGDEDDPPAPIVDTEPPAPPPAKASLLFLMFCVLLCVFVLLDATDTALIALLTPTVTITLVPQARTVTLTSSAALGQLLSPITLSQSVTVPTTGHGHQDAKAATGLVTVYNAAFTPQALEAGTIFIGTDGVAIVTTETVTIPADNPPVIGQGSIVARAVATGAQGNIPALDINDAVSSSLYVKNLAPFTGGQNERDFQIVTQGDIATAAGTLKAQVASSMTAALTGQLLPGEHLHPTPCSPTVTASHAGGDEAATVTVTVAESCTAIAYNTQELTTQATRFLSTQAGETLGQGYRRYGKVNVSVTQATPHQHTVVLSFTAQATYIYQLTERQQQSIVNRILGVNRVTALRQLAGLPGVRHVSISGLADNRLVPDDPQYIHLLIVETLW